MSSGADMTNKILLCVSDTEGAAFAQAATSAMLDLVKEIDPRKTLLYINKKLIAFHSVTRDEVWRQYKEYVECPDCKICEECHKYGSAINRECTKCKRYMEYTECPRRHQEIERELRGCIKDFAQMRRDSDDVRDLLAKYVFNALRAAIFIRGRKCPDKAFDYWHGAAKEHVALGYFRIFNVIYYDGHLPYVDDVRKKKRSYAYVDRSALDGWDKINRDNLSSFLSF